MFRVSIFWAILSPLKVCDMFFNALYNVNSLKSESAFLFIVTNLRYYLNIYYDVIFFLLMASQNINGQICLELKQCYSKKTQNPNTILVVVVYIYFLKWIQLIGFNISCNQRNSMNMWITHAHWVSASLWC